MGATTLRNLFFVALMVPALMCAKLPEPDAIYFGSVFHSETIPLLSSYPGQLLVVARLGGTELARAAIPVDSNRYVLKVPLDDGLAPRISGTARAGERVRVFLVNMQSGFEDETLESSGIGLPISTERGSISASNLRSLRNLKPTAALIAKYTQWKIAAAMVGLSPEADDAHLDLDGDGVSNFDEFLAATDPNDNGSFLDIKEVRPSVGVLSLRFGPVAPSRKYTIESAKAPLGPWTAVRVMRFSEGNSDVWTDVPYTSDTGVFFRVLEEIE